LQKQELQKKVVRHLLSLGKALQEFAIRPHSATPLPRLGKAGSAEGESISEQSE
jgi:hypothetical protein